MGCPRQPHRQWMPYNFVADSIHSKLLCSRHSSSEVQLCTENGRFDWSIDGEEIASPVSWQPVCRPVCNLRMSRVDNNILRRAQVGGDNWFKNFLVLRCRDSADRVELSVCEVKIFRRPIVRYAVHLHITYISIMVLSVMWYYMSICVKFNERQRDKRYKLCTE